MTITLHWPEFLSGLVLGYLLGAALTDWIYDRIRAKQEAELQASWVQLSNAAFVTAAKDHYPPEEFNQYRVIGHGRAVEALCRRVNVDFWKQHVRPTKGGQ